MIADLVTTELARDVVRLAGAGQLRVFAVTTPLSLVAGLAARRLGAPGLALAVGFGRLDGDPEPALTLGEFALGADRCVRSAPVETFVALARGRVGVVVSPAQLDGRAATNLSRIGGTDERPAVALPGSRGLPDNNASPSTVWYLLADHSPRRLVSTVDFVSGAPPAAGYRRLLTPLAVLDFSAAGGWRLVSVSPGVTVEDVQAATGFPVTVGGPDSDGTVPVTPGPSPAEAAALDEVDPRGLRRLEFLPPPDAAALTAELAERERAAWASR